MVTAARAADPELGEELARISDPDRSDVAKVVESLEKAVNGQSVAKSVAAIQVLGRAAAYASHYGGGSPPELLDAVPTVVNATTGSNEEVRIAALNALEGFAAEAGLDVIAAVTARAPASAPETKAAVHALRACGPDLAAGGVGWLTKSLEHPDAEIAELACRTLGWIGAGAVGSIEPIIALAVGQNRRLRREAAGALIAIDPAGKVVSKRVSDPAQREALLMALREKGAEGRDTLAKLTRAWSPKKPKTGKRRRRDDKFIMRELLLTHHGCGTGQFRPEAAGQRELQKLTGWDQPRVSRAMQEIFGKGPMAKYKRSCVDGKLVDYLKGARTEPPRGEVLE